MTTILVSDGTQTHKQISIDDLKALVAAPPILHTTVWVDLDNPSPEEEELILNQIFRFHPLTILDCQRERLSPRHGDHLPKAEDYGDYLFCIINPVEFVTNGHRHDTGDKTVSHMFEVKTRQLNTYLGGDYIITHHYESSPEIEWTIALCGRNPNAIHRGPDYIYHLILDQVVDRYSPLLDRFDEDLDFLEDTVFGSYSPQTLPKILGMKRNLFRLRRITSYQREMVYRLSRAEFSLITEQEIAYYRNVLDHLIRAYELIESYRDITTSLLDAHLSMASNRLNEVMKVLTLFSTFFLPLTFIAGVYGMNFEFMPELTWPYGYLFAWGLMSLTAVGMFVFFRKRKWL